VKDSIKLVVLIGWRMETPENQNNQNGQAMGG